MRRWVVPIASIALVATVTVRADEEAPEAVDPLVGAAAADPLELGRFVQRHGDRYVLVRLGDEQPTDTRLAAVHAAPWLAEPERALTSLARMAGGSDPHLAPAAVWSAHRIAADLDAVALARREARLDVVLSEPRERLGALAEDDSARADIRRVAAFAAAALARLEPDSGGEGEGASGGSKGP